MSTLFNFVNHIWNGLEKWNQISTNMPSIGKVIGDIHAQFINLNIEDFGKTQ